MNSISYVGETMITSFKTDTVIRVTIGKYKSTIDSTGILFKFVLTYNIGGVEKDFTVHATYKYAHNVVNFLIELHKVDILTEVQVKQYLEFIQNMLDNHVSSNIIEDLDRKLEALDEEIHQIPDSNSLNKEFYSQISDILKTTELLKPL